MNPTLAKNISQQFKHAFGMDLTLLRAGGNQFPLYVGDKPVVPPGEDELSREFIDALLATNEKLETQGDGMRSFVAFLLHALTASTHSIQFLDEPEAFLHPPQARLLGRYIAESYTETSPQQFIATHSMDILEGLIEGGSDNIRIIRIRREGNVNHIKELNKQQTKSLAEDSHARFSRVLDGVFYEHVVICESDADCMFYQLILDLPAISGNRSPDALFIHAAGKHRIANLVAILKSLDVPISVIVDIDILNNEQTFRELFEKLGGNWDDVKSHWKVISNHILNKRPILNAEQVVTRINEVLDSVSGSEQFPSSKENEIKRIFKDNKPWGAVKSGGRDALPNGEIVNHFDNLCAICSDLQLWIVRVGELEGFCRSTEGHGPKFVANILEKQDLENDPELHDAREFVKRIWEKAHS